MIKRLWVKLYLEILDDPKMGRLADHLWRRFIELILLAGRTRDDGALPPIEEMAWSLGGDEYCEVPGGGASERARSRVPALAGRCNETLQIL